MPEPSDPLSVRLAAASGLATLLDEARATWLARAERDAEGAERDAERAEPDAGRTERSAGPAPADRGADAVDAKRDVDTANDLNSVSGVDAALGSNESAEVATAQPVGHDSVAPNKPSVRVRPSTPRWRAFEDAFPTFYQFTNRPRS